jgi:DNA polymerase/3'-5' exonuclease PolX
MNHKDAVEIALTVLKRLQSACERICIAGSIRRHKPNCKDVEIVYIPRYQEEQVDMFKTAPVPATEKRISELVASGFLEFDTEVKRNGPKYKRLIHVASSMTIELFRAGPDNWGLIMALRTGPAKFNKLLVTKPWGGGAMPAHLSMRDGYLWGQDGRIDTPTETAFFGAINLPYWAPQERSGEQLKAYLENGQ